MNSVDSGTDKLSRELAGSFPAPPCMPLSDHSLVGGGSLDVMSQDNRAKIYERWVTRDQRTVTSEKQQNIKNGHIIKDRYPKAQECYLHKSPKEETATVTVQHKTVIMESSGQGRDAINILN